MSTFPNSFCSDFVMMHHTYTSDGFQKRPVSTKGEKQSWRDILKAVSMEDPWTGIKREDRPVWREKLEESEKLVRSPRGKLNEVNHI